MPSSTSSRPTHAVGRFKARFFAALGYSQERWHQLEIDVRAQLLTQDAEAGEVLTTGQLWTIRAILKGPNGQSAEVMSVWFVPTDSAAPHFVTVYPRRGK